MVSYLLYIRRFVLHVAATWLQGKNLYVQDVCTRCPEQTIIWTEISDIGGGSVLIGIIILIALSLISIKLPQWIRYLRRFDIVRLAVERIIHTVTRFAIPSIVAVFMFIHLRLHNHLFIKAGRVDELD